jgi:mandelate racemase
VPRCPYDNLDDMARVTSAVRVPICSGENAYYLSEARTLAEGTNISFLSLDLMRCGGITGWRKISASVEGSPVRIVSHTYPQLASQLVCGTVNASHVEDYPLFDGLVGEPIVVKDGLTLAGMAPGIGVAFSDEVTTSSIQVTIA